MTTKKTYRRPNTTVVLLAAESSLILEFGISLV